MATRSANFTEPLQSVDVDVEFLVSLILVISVTLWVITANTLIVIVVALSPKLHRKMYIFIVSLAASDLLNGVIAPVTWYMQTAGGLNDRAFIVCLVMYALMVYPMIASIMNILSVAVDRYLAVQFPLHYHTWLTTRRALSLVTAVWLYATAIVSLLLLWHNNSCGMSIFPRAFMGILTCLHYFVGFIAICYIYGRIYLTARTHHKREVEADHQHANKEFKATKAVIVTVGAFFVCWTPLTATLFLEYVVKVSDATKYLDICYIMAFANSGMNFIIYCAKNKEFRRAFLVLTGRQTQIEPISSIQT